MTTHETIGQFLSSPHWTESEKWVIMWQFNLLGDFQTALASAIKLADEDNLERLRRGFPMQVAGFLQWSQGNLGNRLRNAGLEI